MKNIKKMTGRMADIIHNSWSKETQSYQLDYYSRMKIKLTQCSYI